MKVIEKITLPTKDGVKEFLSEIDTNRNKGAVYNPNMVSFEAYNGDKYDVKFTSREASDIGTEHFSFILKKGDFRLMRHSNYIGVALDDNGIELPQGTPINILMNYGDMKGIENKEATSQNTF